MEEGREVEREGGADRERAVQRQRGKEGIEERLGAV